MIYVACPFWDEDEKTRVYRRKKAIEYSEKLFFKGKLFYSPLLYTERFKEKKQKENFWLNHGLKLVEVCTSMDVLCLPGWEKSNGIQGEVAKAESIGIDVRYVHSHSRVSFHGSRSLSKSQCSQVILDVLDRHQVETVITHGEPHGACEYVRDIAKEKAVSLKLHYLQKHRLAGMFHWRSTTVLEDGEIAIFMHDGISDGTSNELALCKKMGLPFEYYALENDKLVLKQTEKSVENEESGNVVDDVFEKKLDKSVRSSAEYRKFRAGVLKRDKNKCVFCGETELLCVHHIVPFTKNNALAMDVSNGQTLCESCHAGVHGKPQFKRRVN